MAGFLRIGEDFAGRYRIVREVGRGGMGVVYEAVDQELGRSVALKLLQPTLTDDEFQRRFQREASVLARIRSRHIVVIHDFGEYDGLSYLITELMPDGDLQSWTSHRGPMPRRGALSLVAQVSEALADAHAVGVIHRDVKPGNVLLWKRPSGLVPYLCDFGIALDGDKGLTRTGTLVGSPSYMAPERHIGRPADERGDVYSTGCLLWSVLTGNAPYSGTDFQVAESHINAPIPQLATGDPEDDRIDDLLTRCLSKRPEDRIASAADLQQELLSLLAPPVRREPVVPAPAAAVEPVIAPDLHTRTREPAPATVFKRPLGPPPSQAPMAPPADMTQFKRPVVTPPVASGPGAPGAGRPHQDTTGRPRRWPIWVAAAVVLLIIGVVVAALALDGSPKEPASAGAPSTSATPKVVLPVPPAPPPPHVKAAAGYRSVAFDVTLPSGVDGPAVLQWRSKSGWTPAPSTIRQETRRGGDKACVVTRTMTTIDGQNVTSDPSRTCGKSQQPVVKLVRTPEPCQRSADGHSFACQYYSVIAAGFAPGTHPRAVIEPTTGSSWCADPRYSAKFCKQVQIDRSGRGGIPRYFAVGNESGRVVLVIDGVRTKPVHLCGPQC